MTRANALLTLAEDEIHLWLTEDRNIDDPELLAQYHDMLSAEEARQYQRFYFERDRHQYLVTRALTRSVLSRYAAVAPAAWQFGKLEHGRPQILNPEGQALLFNLSHSAGLIVLAICRSTAPRPRLQPALGVDTENIVERAPPLEICPRYFSPAEVAELRGLPAGQQPLRFFHYWTLKESYIKARSLGLALPLEQFSFHFPAHQEVSIRFDPRLEDQAERWRFWLYQYRSTHLIALCASRQATAQRLQIRHCVPLAATTALAPETLAVLYLSAA